MSRRRIKASRRCRDEVWHAKSIVVVYRGHADRVSVASWGDQVLLKVSSSPARVASARHVLVVYRDGDVLAGWNFESRLCPIKILCCEVVSAEMKSLPRHRGGEEETQAILSTKREPSHIAMISIFAGQYVGHISVCHRHGMSCDLSPRASVCVCLMRPSTIELKSTEFSADGKFCSYSSERRKKRRNIARVLHHDISRRVHAEGGGAGDPRPPPCRSHRILDDYQDRPLLLLLEIDVYLLRFEVRQSGSLPHGAVGCVTPKIEPPQGEGDCTPYPRGVLLESARLLVDLLSSSETPQGVGPSIVVVCVRSPEVLDETLDMTRRVLAFCDDPHVLVPQAPQPSAPPAPLDSEPVPSLHHHQLLAAGASEGCCMLLRQGKDVQLRGEQLLMPSQLVPTRSPAGVVLEKDGDLEQAFVSLAAEGAGGDGDLGPLLSTVGLHRPESEEITLEDFHSILPEAPAPLEGRKVEEVEEVAEGEQDEDRLLPSSSLLHLRPDHEGSQNFLSLQGGRMESPVRPREPVDVPLSIMNVFIVEPAIHPARPSVLRLLPHSLIRPVPYEPSLQHSLGPDRLPELVEVPQRVVHRVRVLAHDYWPQPPRRPLRPPMSELRASPILLLQSCQPGELLRARIHRADDVRARCSSATLVLHRTRPLMFSQPRGHGDVVSTVGGLVAKRPDEDTGPVAIPDDHPRQPLHERFLPARVLRQPLLAVLSHQPVSLDVCLIAHPQPVSVAELVEEDAVGVVARSDRVHVQLLHQLEILHHQLAAAVLSLPVIVLVSVHSPHLHWHVVDLQHSILDLNRSHPNPRRLHVHHLILPSQH
mmetsp:Transcript_49783/g.155789  ORF Transcript_49783/g.155789 Transcript_49783/m.155789 type:complete len:818 (-) Transcript_49783:229-2682(-)